VSGNDETEEWLEMLHQMGVDICNTPADPQPVVPTDMSGAYITEDGYCVTVMRWPPSWIAALRMHLRHLDDHPCPMGMIAIMQIAQTIEEMMRPAAAPLARYLIENPELAERHEIDFDLTPEEIQDIFYLRNDDGAWEIDYDGGCDWG
jgi:hypothetical protein